MKFSIHRYGAPLAPVVSYDYPATTVAPTTQTTAAVAEASDEVRTLALDIPKSSNSSENVSKYFGATYRSFDFRHLFHSHYHVPKNPKYLMGMTKLNMIT